MKIPPKKDIWKLAAMLLLVVGFLLGSLIGTLPASFTYNLIGASLGKPVDKIQIATVTAAVIVLAVFLFVRRRKTAPVNRSATASNPESQA